MRFSRQFYNNVNTIPLPTILVTSEEWVNKITMQEAVVYAFMRYRLQLSMGKEKYHDEDGYFIYFSLKELAETFKVTERAVQKWLNKMRDHGLISTKRQGLGKPQKIYINLIESNDDCESVDCENNDCESVEIIPKVSDTNNHSSQRTTIRTTGRVRDEQLGVRDTNDWASPYSRELIQRTNTREYIPPTPQEGVVVEGKSVDEESSSQNNPSPAKQIRTMFESFAGNNQELLEALDGWKEFRGKMTPRAVKLNLSKLYKLSGGDEQKAIEIVNQSVENGWKGFFEIRERSPDRKRQSRQATETEKALKMFEEMEKMENEQDETSPSNHDFFV